MLQIIKKQRLSVKQYHLDFFFGETVMSI